ncbi:MAG: hypothetical protein IJO88_02350 [Oscillospiraceae bacterium]|nr:hypothetical protein [Oscillospiraceae bacterium]
MIRKLFLLAALAAVLRLTGLLPFQSSDVAELVPVQALVISVEAGEVRLDGGDCLGVGTDWDSAWEDLQKSGKGHVFLGTVDHVILCGEALSLLPRVVESHLLRPAASVCSAPDSVPNAKLAAEYLSAHGGAVTLRQLRALRLRPGELRLPQLVETMGGLRIYG